MNKAKWHLSKSIGNSLYLSVFLVLLLSSVSLSQSDSDTTHSGVIKLPEILSLSDTPNDHGKSVQIRWGNAEFDSTFIPMGYAVFRSESASAPFDSVGFASITKNSFVDASLEYNNRDYYYKLKVIGTDQYSNVVGPVQGYGQWFHTGKTTTFVVTVLFCGIVLGILVFARRGGEFYIRPIAGINAIDDAIGRATEMGKPILFVPGLGTASDVATIAAFTIMGRVAKRTAEYQSRVIVPCYYPETMIVAQEVIKSAYLDAGRPDMYNEKEVYYVTTDQFPYTAAVNGVMLRDKPATNFFLGKFYAESLMLAETGFEAGAIQIAGTDEAVQIPFFVAACDYTLIGEELYAASAYLSRDPMRLGTLKAQDWGKAGIVIFLIVGIIVASVWGSDFFIRLLDVNVN
ncbi:MAG: hypothetical protein GY855_00840 [candidate division Zixibacteria bacterium]|nr:hypothetical protein [candidate division Zixibacteria bacterium]